MKQRLFLILLLLFLPAASYAATVQLPETGQTGCWDGVGNTTLCTDPLGTGQDGAIRAGAAWPATRFVANGDGTVTDHLTGLIWLKNAGCFGLLPWASALASANTLASGSCGLSDGSVAGDWRLPNIRELETLLNAQQAHSSDWLTGRGFTNVTTSFYWSSSSLAANPVRAWAVSLYGGGVFSQLKDDINGYLAIWPVRGGDPGPSVTIALPRTGQTACWDSAGTEIDCAGTGQDFAIHAGVLWPNPRFVDNGDGTLTDHLTGLIWLKDANCFGGKTWLQALAGANTLASGACGLTDGSAAGDWRLPNRRELHSLINFQALNMATWLTGRGFGNVRADPYWSSSTVGLNLANAWSVVMDFGSVQGVGKGGSNFVWPVRGGRSSLLTVTRSGAGSGDVTPDQGALTWDGPVGTASYPEDTVVTLSATPDPGWYFLGWSGAGCSGTGPCQVALGANQGVTASFDALPACASPGSIKVPAGDADGSFLVTWTASVTAGATYLLQEATDPLFTAGLRTAYQGKALKVAISKRKLNRTYYYRIKASHTGYADSDYRSGGNGCAVPGTAKTAPPAAITVPPYADDGYTVSWPASTTAGARYVLEEATDPAFAGGWRIAAVSTATSAIISGRAQGTTYYYRVRAIKAGFKDSAWRVGERGCAVPGLTTAGMPASLTMPLTDADGAYLVSWGLSATTDAVYVLEEATTPLFSSWRVAYLGTATGTGIVGRKQNKTYYYRIKAVTAGAKDSGYLYGGYGCAVPGNNSVQVPKNILVPATDDDGSYTVSWGKTKTLGARYVLEEATSPDFGEEWRIAYYGTALKITLTGRTLGTTYYYRVRAVLPGWLDSDHRTAANGCSL